MVAVSIAAWKRWDGHARAPLANGASINLQFLLGIQQTGTFKIYSEYRGVP